MRENLVDTLLGAAVLAVAAVFLVFAYRTADIGKVEGYELVAQFEKVDGVRVGTDVLLSGIKIGTVTEQELDTKAYLAVLRFSVAERVKVPEDSSIKITSDGLLGNKYLSVQPGGSDTMLKPGQEIRFTQGSVDLMELLGKALYSSQGGGERK
ncbi:MAG: outer membrane lipid asymmetry maintenance protein MlaD [Alphaproteobacteria bacterium]|nr:outer membrane lipid asymmetry maintenance protein MlaD [Alphaproteobacteria bacterium]